MPVTGKLAPPAAPPPAPPPPSAADGFPISLWAYPPLGVDGAVTLAQPATEPPILASSHLPQRRHLRHHRRLRQTGSPSRCGHIHRWAQIELSPSHSLRQNRQYWQAHTSRSAATCATTAVCGRWVPHLAVGIYTVGRGWSGEGRDATDHHVWLIHILEMYCN